MTPNSGTFQKGNVPWNKNQILKTCKNCSKCFSISVSRDKDKRGIFCSLTCKNQYKFKLARNFVLTPDLAELIGIIIGDGCISRNPGRKDYRIQISGNPLEDKDYFENYIPALLFRVLKIKVIPYIGKNGAYIIQFQSEPFRIFLHSLGIISPKAKIVSIPDEIKRDDELLLSCVRGIADTDFTLIFTKRGKSQIHNYPRISAQFASSTLVRDLELALRKRGFTLSCKYNYLRKDKRGFAYITNFINLDGPYNLERWLQLIGFANQRILTRYCVWKRYHCLEPKSTLLERKKLLMG